MDDLEVATDTILILPDQDGDVEIEIDDDFGGVFTRYVSFKKLEAWVASIQEQIIPVATSQEPCKHCKPLKEIFQSANFCAVCGLSLNR